jgi:hypothetical protein
VTANSRGDNPAGWRLLMEVGNREEAYPADDRRPKMPVDPARTAGCANAQLKTSAHRT